MTELENRRPLKTRGKGWSQDLAARLAKARVSPDLLSAGSVAVAVLGAAALCSSGLSSGVGRVIFLLVAAVCVQLRLLANMMDGLVAVEHGRGSPQGPIWNELPDRIADALFLAGAGYGAFAAGHEVGAALGWLCAVLALLTAYIRELGRSLGQPADFRGPMAKPHRMFALTLACAVAIFEPLWGWSGQTFLIALAIIAVGAVATAWRRTRLLAQRLGDAAEG
jgi:phosphatidylglycerophosphate synthase